MHLYSVAELLMSSLGKKRKSRTTLKDKRSRRVSQKFMTLQSFGVIGLAVMGENIALNVERNGFPIAVYNRSREKTDKFMAERAQGRNVKAAFTLEEFVASLNVPEKS